MNQVHPAVKALIINDHKFLILKQKLETMFFWDLPGGKIQYGESPTECLQRELLEEIGLKVEIKEPVGAWYFFRLDGNQIVCLTYRCALVGQKTIDLTHNVGHENIVEYDWITKDEFLTPEHRVNHDSLKDLIKEINF